MFPELVELLGRADKNKDVYNAVDIYPDDPVGKIMAIVQWLDEKGVRDLPRIPTNCNVLDDEDIETIWKYIVERKQDAAGPVQRSQWTVRPNLLYKVFIFISVFTMMASYEMYMGMDIDTSPFNTLLILTMYQVD